MEKENYDKRNKLMLLLPVLILAALTILIVFYKFGNFYLIKLDGEKIPVSFISILSGKYGGPRVAALFWAIYIVLPLVAAGLLFLNKFHKNFAFISFFIFLLCGVISIVSKDILAEVVSNNLEVECKIKEVYVLSIIATIFHFVCSIVILSLSTSDLKFTTRDITESGILIAAALILNFIKLFPAPTGGSVNLQMLPLFILALRRGPLKGFIGCGIVYGLISCLTDGYGLAFYPFDYLIGFGGAAVLGFFSKYILPEDKKTYNFKGELFLLIGGILTMLIRFISGSISSMLFYSYPIGAAFLYNVGYVFISGVLSLAIIMLLYGPLLKVNAMFPPQKN